MASVPLTCRVLRLTRSTTEAFAVPTFVLGQKRAIEPKDVTGVM